MRQAKPFSPKLTAPRPHNGHGPAGHRTPPGRINIPRAHARTRTPARERKNPESDSKENTYKFGSFKNRSPQNPNRTQLDPNRTQQKPESADLRRQKPVDVLFRAAPGQRRLAARPCRGTSLIPVGSVEAAVLHGLGEVFGADLFSSVEVGDGPCHFQDSVVGAGAEAHAPHGHLEGAFAASSRAQ